MDAGVVQHLLAFGNPQEARALLKGFRPKLGHLFQLRPAGEGAVFFPVGHNVLSGDGGQAGHLLQKTPGGGVGIHTHVVHAVLHHTA